MLLKISWEGSPTNSTIEVNTDTRIGDIIKKHLSQFANSSDYNEDLEAYLENSKEELSKDSNIAELGLKEGETLHFNRCSKIDVTVCYGDKETVLNDLHPSFILKKVEKKAIRELEVDETTKTLQLKLKGGDEVLDDKLHLGCLTTYPSCKVSFELCPKTVTITIKDIDYQIIPKAYLAKELRILGGIPDGYLLVKIKKNEQLKKIEDQEKVVIHGGEVFDCQPFGGQSS